MPLSVLGRRAESRVAFAVDSPESNRRLHAGHCIEYLPGLAGWLSYIQFLALGRIGAATQTLVPMLASELSASERVLEHNNCLCLMHSMAIAAIASELLYAPWQDLVACLRCCQHYDRCDAHQAS